MLKSLFLTALALVIALGGGAGSVWLALDSDFEFDTIEVGDWTAFPTRGTPDADPYSKARFSRTADLLAGRGEGLTFTAKRDSNGFPLSGACSYRLEGPTPPARFWTLYARDEDGRVIDMPGNRAAALHSYAVLRQEDQTIVTRVSAHPQPGNWLPVKTGEFLLVLSLYDTAISSSSRIGEVVLPRIVREACDG